MKKSRKKNALKLAQKKEKVEKQSIQKVRELLQ